ncbi:MAG: hypothetical protein LBR45_01825 [Bacteroidales bacterium]|nr:hypothetical protein [Bacteroidales bacterium]
MRNTVSIMEDGMHYLIEKLGVIETEIFISQVLKEPFDYTKWQREHYADMSVSELNEKAVEYGKNNPVNTEK